MNKNLLGAIVIVLAIAGVGAAIYAGGQTPIQPLKEIPLTYGVYAPKECLPLLQKTFPMGKAGAAAHPAVTIPAQEFLNFKHALAACGGKLVEVPVEAKK